MAAEFDAHRSEQVIVQAVIDARRKAGLTQRQLSEKTGIAQPDISKIENGDGNPSVRTLQRIAAGMDMELHIEFRRIVGN